MNPVRSLARDKVASPQDFGGATSNGMKRSTFIFYVAVFAAAFLLTSNPVLAVEGTGDAVKEIKLQFSSLQDEFRILRETLAGLPKGDGAAERQAALQRFSAKVQAFQQRLAELRSQTAGGPAAEKTLKRGVSGDVVKKLQGLLKNFPDLYPEGLDTGYFGPATEKAIKRLQEKFGLEQVGSIGPKTGEKLAHLERDLNHHKPPKIQNLDLKEASIGMSVTISGAGFTLEDNAIFVRGRTIVKGLPSEDGGTLITFKLPQDIPCLPEQACPIKVVNANGISNARPIKIVLPPPPTDEPKPPEPVIEPAAPPPPPPPAPPVIISLSPAILVKGEPVTLTGTGFAALNNTVTFTGSFDKPNQVINGVASPDGATLKVNVPLTMPCNVVSECSVFVSNQNGVSNRVTFWLGQKIDPVTVLAPNGGETVSQGVGTTLSASGGTSEAFYGNVSVSYALVDPQATAASDPSELILGWIVHMSLQTSVFKWDAIKLCDWDNANAALPAPGSCWRAEPGSYKILAVGKDTLNKPTIWDQAANKPGNIDLSDSSFAILPAPSIRVLAPNGGEKWIIGDTVTVTWEMVNVQKKRVQILLYDTVAQKVITGIVQDLTVGADTGTFIYNWVVPSWIPVGSNYTVWVQEYDFVWGQARDWSDANFTVALKSALTVTAPNGGELWFQGFKGKVRWSSANILSKAVTVKLLKSGVAISTLASSQPQGHSWTTSTFTGGTFETKFVVPADVPVGNDYTIEISDSADASVKDVSNAPFSILAVPDPVTWTGRLIDHFTKAPLANKPIYTHAFYGNNLPQWSGTAAITDSNGAFTVSTTTRDGFVLKIPSGSWPTCYMNYWDFIYATPYGDPEQITYRHAILDFLPDETGVLTSSPVNLGDIGMWPATGLYFYSDVPPWYVFPGTLGLYSPGTVYAADGVSYGGYQILVLGHDIQVIVTDTLYNRYYSPSINISLANGCTPVTLTYVNGVFAWQPYNLRATYTGGISPAIYSVGSSLTLKPAFWSGASGAAPYTYGLFYGSLPPGFTLDPNTGIISGTFTTPGTYKFQVKITDSKGVVGGSYIHITITVQ